MARQIIGIGIQGNDGTGDSIRESFRKVNENFSELYGIFGGETIAFTDLDDAPSSYQANQIIISDPDGASLLAKTLVSGPGIQINTTDPNQLTISMVGGYLINEGSPTISASINGSGQYTIGNIPDPSVEVAAAFNATHNTDITEYDLAIPKRYADATYVKKLGDTMQGPLQLQPGSISNIDISNDAAIAQSKLALIPASTTNLGIAGFDGNIFTVTDGFASIKSEGVALSKIQTINAGTVLGNRSAIASVPTAINFIDVVKPVLESNTNGIENIYATTFNGNLAGTADRVKNGVYTTDFGTVTNTMLAGQIANDKLENATIIINGAPISLGDSINIDRVINGVYTTDIGTVTNTMLAGQIANDKLANDTITINGVSISLGGSGEISAGAESLTGEALASNIINSSLTSLGTLSSVSYEVATMTSLGQTLDKDINVLNTATAEESVYLPAAGGRRIIIRNEGPEALSVFPPQGGTINTLDTDNAYTLSIGGMVEFVSVSSDTWYTL